MHRVHLTAIVSWLIVYRRFVCLGLISRFAFLAWLQPWQARFLKLASVGSRRVKFGCGGGRALEVW